MDSQQKKQYRAIGHNLKPIVIISENGLSDGAHQEMDRALNDHELIKVKLNINDAATRKILAGDIAEKHNAELIQIIGKMALILRRSKTPNPKLSNLLRPI